MTTNDTADEELTSYDDATEAAKSLEIHRGEHPPSSRYDGCLTAAEVNARFLELWNEAADELGPHSWTNPLWKERRNALGEDMRRAHVRIAASAGKGPTTKRGPRADIPDVHPVSNDEPITCVGKCGETKPAKKFPTLNGRPGRAAECRDCRDTRLADQRSAG